MEPISEIRERVIRIEERQQGISKMLESALGRHDTLNERVTGLEAFKNKILGVAILVGSGVGIFLDTIKNKIFGGS